MTFPKMVNSELSWSSDCDTGSKVCKVQKRTIIVANFLPLLQIKKNNETGRWCVKWDEDALLLQLKHGFSADTEVVYVGRLKFDVDSNQQEEVARELFSHYKCIPTFLPHEMQTKFYHGFCKQGLWPLLHNMLPLFSKCGLVDASLFEAYLLANIIFADTITKAIESADHDCVWVHDYHLMLLPILLRKKVKRVKLGLFLHSPFPSYEIYKTLPQRAEILNGLLNADLIGFQSMEYAQNFLSCCSRLFGLDHECSNGYLELKYCGRTVSITILPVGVHVGHIQSVLNLPATISKVQELEQKFKGKKLILGVDDMDILKGIDRKLDAFELLLKRKHALVGEVILVQIVNPARSTGKDVEDARLSAIATTSRINISFGHEGYQPVVLIEGALPSYEKIAYSVVADCCVVNAYRDGMNLIPYEFVVCRQGSEEMDRGRSIEPGSPHTSTVIVSEFIGCSPSLSGALRVNPWNTEDVADALYKSVRMSEYEKELRHEMHYHYVSSHDMADWSKSFMQDLHRACKDHGPQIFWLIGLDINFKIMAIDYNFKRLSRNQVSSSYQSAARRAIFLDYDGTLVPNNSFNAAPGEELLSILGKLCSNPNNVVFIVSGRDRSSLGEWFPPCESLGIAAEHGFFIRWNQGSEWESRTFPNDFEWKKIVEPIMQVYTETTDGSCIESKESALVWHYRDADPEFGPCQANELTDHLKNMLANEPVVVKMGLEIVEVKPQGVGKGMVVMNVLKQLAREQKAPDFVLCIGDDKSDEEMFESINNWMNSGDMFPAAPQVFTCTIQQKPSKAKYFVSDVCNVIDLLKELSSVSSSKRLKAEIF